MEEGNKEDLRKSHFNFGDSVETESYSHNIHKDLLQQAKQINNGADFKAALVDDLRKNHFQLGYTDGRYLSSQREAFKDFGIQNASLQKEKTDDLKKHHFELGNGEPLKNSVYKDTYNWKTPIQS